MSCPAIDTTIEAIVSQAMETAVSAGTPRHKAPAVWYAYLTPEARVVIDTYQRKVTKGGEHDD